MAESRYQFRRVDESCIGDHPMLADNDCCWYLYEYTSGAGYKGGKVNELILNLKKKPSKRAEPGFCYKEKAINKCIHDLKQALGPKALEHTTLVPMPGSKIKNHADYDDRMERICRGLQPGGGVLLVDQTESIVPAHETPKESNRPTVNLLKRIWKLDESRVNDPSNCIAVVDDLLVAGTHFRAMNNLLIEKFPTTRIIGVFIARRIFPKKVSELDAYW